VTILACRESVFFDDQPVQVSSEENRAVQPDVPVWLLVVGRSQAAAFDLPEKQRPQIGGEEIIGW
jgi:hypothetical protein